MANVSCITAAVYDESSGEEQVFDIGQLRLRFSIVKQGSPAINVRFDSWTARFSGKGVDFTWSELMFRPELCLQRLQREVEAELASFTPALLAKAFRGEL